jgi:hypothetical protein
VAAHVRCQPAALREASKDAPEHTLLSLRDL